VSGPLSVPKELLAFSVPKLSLHAKGIKSKMLKALKGIGNGEHMISDGHSQMTRMNDYFVYSCTDYINYLIHNSRGQKLTMSTKSLLVLCYPVLHTSTHQSALNCMYDYCHSCSLCRITNSLLCVQVVNSFLS